MLCVFLSTYRGYHDTDPGTALSVDHYLSGEPGDCLTSDRQLEEHQRTVAFSPSNQDTSPRIRARPSIERGTTLVGLYVLTVYMNNFYCTLLLYCCCTAI